MTAAIEFAHADRSLRPQDDLFRFMNGAWLRTARIEPDQSSAGGFMDLHNAAERDVRELIEECEGELDTDEGRIAALYRSFMDADRIEELGAAPLAPIFAAIDAVDSPARWPGTSAGRCGTG